MRRTTKICRRSPNFGLNCRKISRCLKNTRLSASARNMQRFRRRAKKSSKTRCVISAWAAQNCPTIKSSVLRQSRKSRQRYQPNFPKTFWMPPTTTRSSLKTRQAWLVCRRTSSMQPAPLLRKTTSPATNSRCISPPTSRSCNTPTTAHYAKRSIAPMQPRHQNWASILNGTTRKISSNS